MLDLKSSEVLRPRQVTHCAALADKDLPKFLKTLDAYGGDAPMLNALRLVILTAT
jgi:hypothetical protein